MLQRFYNLTLIMFETINFDIYLKFRMYDFLFNYLNKIEMTIRDNECCL